MSEGPDIDVQALAHLDALAALDLSAAEKAHGALMAAEPKDIPELSRAYRGLARSLRQTLALKDRLRRQRAERGPSRPDPAPDPGRVARAGRMDILAHAVREAAADLGCEPDEQADLAERFHAEAWDWIERPDFLHEDLDTQIRRALTLIDLIDDDTEDEGDDVIEGQAREVTPEPGPPQAPERPHDDGEGLQVQPPEPLPEAPEPPPQPPSEPTARSQPGRRWDVPDHEPPAPVSPPSPDPFANWPRRIIPDHPFNSS